MKAFILPISLTILAASLLASALIVRNGLLTAARLPTNEPAILPPIRGAAYSYYPVNFDSPHLMPAVETPMWQYKLDDQATVVKRETFVWPGAMDQPNYGLTVERTDLIDIPLIPAPMTSPK